jgi:hypothetical protein
MTSRHQQQGITLSGLIFGCILLGILALTGMKLFPLYNEKMKVDFAMENVAGTAGSARLSKTEVVRAILKQFEVSDVDRFDRHNLGKILKVDKKKGSTVKIVSIAYEIRGEFFGDLDLILKYNNAVELSAAAKTE